MEWIDKVLQGLYEKRLLRDVFGKMAPGFLSIALSVALYAPLSETAQRMKSLLSGTWIDGFLVAGVLWLAGFVVQSLGERIGGSAGGGGLGWKWGLASYPNAHLKESGSHFNARRIAFELDRLERYRQQRERLVVVKEATGNAGYAVVLALVVSLIARGLDDKFGLEGTFWAAWITTLIAALGLLWKHVSTRAEQARHEITSIEEAHRAEALPGFSEATLAAMRANAGLAPAVT